MKIASFLISSLLTIALVYVLNQRIGPAPAFGSFLSPQHGFWQNAEAYDADYNADLKLPGLNGPVNVYFDERLVPHIYSDNQLDAVYIQGYLHAKFRLWQMEFQTHAAAGRISEVIGDKALNYDREQRRLGMVYAAENMLEVMEADPLTKSLCDAYTAGVNAYIESLPESQLPVEYKLLGYKPERWNNLKIALFVKAMNKTLAGYAEDLSFTAVKSWFTNEQMQLLFPAVPDSLDPIVPKGTVFDPPGVLPIAPAGSDSAYLGKKDSLTIREIDKPHPDNGSNNWVVAGKKTQSGAPILCNDPHLELTLPAIWYEMQMSGPDNNVYGTSFPGIPGIVIGFNDSIAWGVTNSQRDVRDYYEIQFKDATRSHYRFQNQWKEASLRVETIKVKGKANVYDTVSYTIFGPVMYDDRFSNNASVGKTLAVRWKAHDPSNEALAFFKLNHARNYKEYLEAIQLFQCPAQNFVFASKSGDIAIWQQGGFPARWNQQGLYVMPGADSSYMWQGMIPQSENPHSFNPEQGFLSSANQRPVDGGYPYFIPGGYDLYRGITINNRLRALTAATVEDMKQLQNDNYNSLAATAKPVLLKNLNDSLLSSQEKFYYDVFKQWNLQNGYQEKGATLFVLWYDTLMQMVFNDELSKMKEFGLYPAERTLLEAVLRDSAFSYVDDKHTPQVETWKDMVLLSFKAVVPKCMQLEKEQKLEWGVYKNTTVYHLLRSSLMPFARTGLPIGGGRHIVNATQHNHGPSWKMIIHLKQETEAFVVYPGGQSGNPGSRYYDQFVDTWASGSYYKAWIFRKGQESNPAIKWRMTFSKS